MESRIFVVENIEIALMVLFSRIAVIFLLIGITGCQAQQSKKSDVRKIKLEAPKGRAIAAFGV